MQHTSRRLTQRSRVAQACEYCRKSKVKCDGVRPSCKRCVDGKFTCVYATAATDKRLVRHEQRRTTIALQDRVRELEAQLSASKRHPQVIGPRSHREAYGSSASPHDVPPSSVQSGDTAKPESTADSLATGHLDQPPALDIGYFGPTSNHAFFWQLTAAIDNLGYRSGYVPRTQTQSHAQRRQSTAMQPISSDPQDQGQDDISSQEGSEFPTRQVATSWTKHFFDNVGAVLPFVNEAAVLREVNKLNHGPELALYMSPSWRALLSIIFAYALFTLGGESPERFYSHCISLLDENTLSSPSIESVQALCLLGSFQQNTQRAMESWTTNYLMVKAAYQIGIHASLTYENYSAQDKQARAALWLAVVNHDRVFSCAIGRTSLIPPQHVQDELFEFASATTNNRAVPRSSKQSTAYFSHVSSLHQIMGGVVDSLYNYNISTSKKLPFNELVSRTMTHAVELQNWCDTIGSLSPAALPVSISAERYEIILLLYYYRAYMHIHSPLLNAMLEKKTQLVPEDGQPVLYSAATALLKEYLATIQNLLRLLYHIMQHDPLFLKRNAVWWLCNYMMFTISLNSFAFWIIEKDSTDGNYTFGLSRQAIKIFLIDCLSALKLIGGASVMSRKAHRCLHGYLELISSKEEVEKAMQQPIPAAVDAVANGPATVSWDELPYDATLSQLLGTNIGGLPDMSGTLTQEDMLANSLLGFIPDISDFDATGFI